VSWILTFLGISLLVVLHELGHFAVAKAVGMRVERFSLFFGPMIVKVRRGETEYGIGTIPLGGYVRIAGMNPLETLPEGEEHRGYFRQAVWKRVAVIAAGPAMNVLLAFLILTGVYWLSAQHPYSNRARVVSVEAGHPAAAVLRKGDEILAVDGHPIAIEHETFNFIEKIGADRCTRSLTAGCSGANPILLGIRRAGKKLTVSVTPRYEPKLKRMLIGVTSGEALRRDSLGTALGASISQMWSLTSQTVSKIGQIFTSSKARRQVHGIVGVSDVASQAFSFGVAEALYVLALISLSLAVINLFPFLPLYGGHLFWALAEKVRGRAIPFSVMERASVAGIALVLVLAAIGLSNDISSLSNGGLTLHR
jgi:regulator of sigma E protease